MVLKVVEQSWVEIICVAAASAKKKDPPAAKQPQGTPRKGKVWGGKKTLVEEGGTRAQVCGRLGRCAGWAGVGAINK